MLGVRLRLGRDPTFVKADTHPVNDVADAARTSAWRCDWGGRSVFELLFDGL